MDRICLPWKEEQLGFVKFEFQVVCRHPLLTGRVQSEDFQFLEVREEDLLGHCIKRC